MALSRPAIFTAASKLLFVRRSSASSSCMVRSVCSNVSDPVTDSENGDSTMESRLSRSERERVWSVAMKLRDALSELFEVMEDPNLQITSSDLSRIDNALSNSYWQPFQMEGLKNSIKVMNSEDIRLVRIDMPGLRKEGMKLWMEKDELHLRGEEKADPDSEYCHKNYSPRTYRCSIDVDPKSFQTDRIRAALRNNGVAYVRGSEGYFMHFRDSSQAHFLSYLSGFDFISVLKVKV